MDYSDLRVMRIEHRVQPHLAFDNVYARVMKAAQTKIKSESDLERYLRAWWCIRYNRPYRDPLLLGYTLEELIVEYLDVSYRSNPDAFKKAKEQQQAQKEDDTWAEAMAAKFGEKLMSKDEQAKHEDEIEEALEKHSEETEVDDILSLGAGVHHKFDVPE